MTLNKEATRKINKFVRERPRNIQEIADLIDKSWRTADRWVKQIAKEEGTIDVHTFRGGTRGALKVVYWRNPEQIHSSRRRQRMWDQIKTGREKVDFSPFDLFETVDEDKRNAFLEQQKEENVEANHDIGGALQKAEQEILIFSGNLSWSTLKQDGREVRQVFKELAQDDISIKFLSRVDITSLKNVELMRKINEQIGKKRVSIRHCEQPVRAVVIDSKLAQFKEMKNPEDYKRGELEKKTYIFYEIYDEEWIDWTRKAFWKLYRNSIPAESRMEDLHSIQNILKV